MSEFLQTGQHPDADQVSAFVDHALPPHEQKEMLTHLAVCAECRETVALSLPPHDVAPLPAGREKMRWLWVSTLLAPAVAAGLAAVLLYIHFAQRPHGAKGPFGPVAALENPPAPAQRANVASASVQSPKLSAKKSRQENLGGATANRPGVSITLMDAVSSSAEAAQEPSELADRDLESLAEAAPFPTALPHEEKPRVLLQSAAADQGAVAEKKKLAEWHLPGGAAPLSAVARGEQVLAIGPRNSVFLSNDGGSTWTAVQVPWKSRAVRAEVISYSAGSARQREFSANGMAPRGQSAGAAGIPAGQSAPPPASPAPAAEPAQSATASPPASPNQPAATPGSLTGMVTDRSGATIPRASVVVTDPASHATRTAQTDANGQYRVDGLAPGAYDVQALAPGFRATIISAVRVAPSQASAANLMLDVGAASETVMVDAGSSQMQTLSPALDEKMDLKAKAAALMAPSNPLFQITTDNGDHWTSADGVTWRRR